MARAAARKRSTTTEAEGGGTSLAARLGALAKSLFVADEDEAPSQHAREVVGIFMLFGSVWLWVALISYHAPFGDPGAQGYNWGGRLGFFLATAAHSFAGAAGHVLAVLGLAWGVVLIARKTVPKVLLRLFSALAFILSLGFLLHLAFRGADGRFVPTSGLPYGAGGWFPNEATPMLEDKVGGPGLWILMLALALVSFMLATNMAFYPLLLELGQWAKKRREERGESFARALVTWVRNMFLGLWDFLRGARLGESAEARNGTGVRELAPVLAAAGAATAVPATVGRRPKNGKPEELPPTAKNADLGDLSDSEDDEEVPAAGSFDGLDDDEVGDPDGDDFDEDAIAVNAATEDDFSEEDSEGIGGNGTRPDDDLEGSGDPEDFDDEEGHPEDDHVIPSALPKAAIKAGPKSGKTGLVHDLPFEPPTPPPGEWRLPPLELLEPPDGAANLDEKSIQAQARKLEAALLSFRVEATVCGAKIGPTVILYELEVSQGTRMNKVTQLSQEIAAALRAQSVRIIAPIPGKATIGIEVPNGARRKVRISELVNQSAYDKKAGALPLFLGIDAEGFPIIEDLARMPHLLIAGTTGSGKSVCINTILASFLLTRSPHDVQMILIDPKMVELQLFEKIPHLMLPVVTDMRQATKVIEWAVEKMEGRYELFRAAGVKNLKGYNALGEAGLRERLGDEFSDRTPRHVPYIIVVVDEFADLMMQAKKEAEQAITRLAQKSRAVGIHVILATQRPSTDVITGVIKGNLPTRIAFQVASKVDSRVILDAMGAEKLLGGGDMLYNPPQSSRIKRVQGALVEDHEIKALVDFVCTHSAQNFNQELKQLTTGTAQPGAGEGFETALDDPMWDEAVRVILKSKRGSASLLQRALGVGYTRASRLLDMMGEAGIVSDHKGSKAREVLMTIDQWEEQHGSELPGGSRGSDA